MPFPFPRGNDNHTSAGGVRQEGGRDPKVRIEEAAILLTTLFVATLIYANYSVGIERRIQALPWYAAIGAFFGFFCLLLALVWGLQYEWGYKERAGRTLPTLRRGHIEVTTSAAPSGYFRRDMLLILAIAAGFFSLKMVHWDLTPLLPHTVYFPWDRYTLLILQLPLKLLLLFTVLFACRRFGLLEKGAAAVAESSVQIVQEAAGEPIVDKVADAVHEEVLSKVLETVVDVVQEKVAEAVEAVDALAIQEKVTEMVMEKVAEAVQKKAAEAQQQQGSSTEDKKDIL